MGRETVAPGPNTGWDTAIALDKAGHPRISYYDAYLGDLKYSRKVLGIWETFYVDSNPQDAGSYSSLAMDESGRPHMSYYNATSGDLVYAYGPAEVVDVAEHEPGVSSGMAIHPNPSHGGPVQIRYAAASALKDQVRVSILDVTGRKIRTLDLDGSGAATWDGRDEHGRLVQAGLHFVVPSGGGTKANQATRLVVVR